MKQIKRLVTGQELDDKITSGLKQAYILEKAGYGPKAGNVLLEQNYGPANISRDGITNIRRFFLEDPVENAAVRAVAEASAQSNKNVGDGTTATILLSILLYEESRKQLAAGKNRMEVSRRLKEVSYNVNKQLKELAKPFNNELLPKIAEVSAGSEELGILLSELFTNLGIDGQVVVEAAGEDGVIGDVIEGFWFPKGFTHLALANDSSNLVSKHSSVPILMCERPMRTTSDIAPLLERILKELPNEKEIVLIGEIGNEVADLLVLNHVKGIINVTPVEPLGFEGKRSLFLDDLASVIGGRPFRGSAEDFNINHLGYADKVLIDGKSTTIVIDRDNEDNDELIRKRNQRIAELKQQLAETSEIIDVDALRERITRLEGRLGFIRVGAPTELERNELKLRVDDAVCAIKSAPALGVLPGGGVALARVDAEEFSEAYQRLIMEQADNAGLNPQEVLFKIKQAKDWQGINFKTANSVKLTNMLKEGIIDSCRVVEEIVKNASSIASMLITVQASTVFIDRDEKVE